MGRFEDREILYRIASYYHTAFINIKVILVSLEIHRPEEITDFHIRFLEHVRDIFENAHQEAEEVIRNARLSKNTEKGS